jgi:hypothetical protein
MSEPHRSATDGADFATVDLIAEARRPLLIARHRELVTEMERSLAPNYISGEVEHRRLQAMLAELDTESETARTKRTLKLLAEDEHYRDATLQQGLTDFLCLMREEGNVEVAALQMHAIGVYRAIRSRLVLSQGGVAPTLDELRELSTTAIGILLDPPEPVFGVLGVPQVHTRTFISDTLRAIKALRTGDQPGQTWTEEDSAVAVTRADEEQVKNMPEGERAAALAFLIGDRIRSQFYRAVFLDYLSVDTFEPSEAEAHPTVLAWLQSMAETPHLYPFLQGQPTAQKSFRIARLTQKLGQLFEIYARVAQARGDARHRATLAKGTTRECLQYLSRQHYPPIPATPELTLATLLCPFKTFVEFVQTRVQAGDFVLPPDPKR